MMASMVFRGRVTDQGVLELPPREAARRAAYLRTMAGKELVETLKRPRVKRSNEQNAYIHLAATWLCKRTGDSVDDMKWALMGHKWGWRYSAFAGREVPVKPRTSSMTVEESSEFIEWLPVFAMAKLEIYIPLPNEVDLSEEGYGAGV